MLPEMDDIQVERVNQRESDNKANKRSVNIDMNPMVDLAFLLLTFFMLATTFSKPQAMELLIPAKPKNESAEQEMAVKESKTVSLVLKKEDVEWYRGITDPEPKSVAYDELEPLLISINEITDGLVVLIKPLESSNYGHLVDVLDALNYSDVQRYAISELSDFDKELDSSESENDE